VPQNCWRQSSDATSIFQFILSFIHIPPVPLVSTAYKCKRLLNLTSGRQITSYFVYTRIDEACSNSQSSGSVQTGSGAHPPSYPMDTGTLSPGVKRPGLEADHLPPSSAEVKNRWSYTSTPPYVLMALYLVKHGYNFTFTNYHFSGTEPDGSTLPVLQPLQS